MPDDPLGLILFALEDLRAHSDFTKQPPHQNADAGRSIDGQSRYTEPARPLFCLGSQSDMIGLSPDRRAPQRQTVISLWIKVPYTVFVGVLIPTYWVEYGPANFFWASDVALFGTLIALWIESRLLISMMAIGCLLPAVLWNIDFLARLAFGPEALPVDGTRYMFDVDVPLVVRGLSTFHIALPAILVWLVYRHGYQQKALLWQTLLAWLILPVTYAVTDPAANINWVYGFGGEPQAWIPGPLFVALLMILIPLAFYLPAHLLLKRLFSAS